MALYVRTGNGGANADYLIADLGYTVLTGASWTPISYSDKFGPGNGSGQFTDIELKESFDLYFAITTAALEWSVDGIVKRTDTYDADVALVIDISNNDFNLTDGYLVLPNRLTPPPGTPRGGEIFYDTNDGYLVFYDGYHSMYTQLSQGNAVSDHGALTGLGDDDHPQYLLLAGNATRNAITGVINDSSGRLRLPSNVSPVSNFTSPFAGEIAFDSDDGYLLFYDGTTWRRDGYKADHGELTGLSDDDHSQYGLLTGNATRNHITGTYSFADGYLTLPVDAFAPVVNVVGGAVTVVAGILYVYDSTRAKWLSVHRDKFITSRNATASTIYLRVGEGIASSATGIRMARNGTITSLAAQSDGIETWVFEIRKNDSVSVIASLTMTAVVGNQSNTINVDVSQGDELQFFMNGSSVDTPVGIVEVAWRI